MLYGIKMHITEDKRAIALPQGTGPDARLSHHFKVREMACRHCGSLGPGIDVELLRRLERLREKLGGIPLIVNSGYRCEEHNRAVGGAENSLHRFGYAADIRSPKATPAEIREAALELDFPGVAQYKSFVHVDTRPLYWQPPFWRPEGIV